MAGSGRVVAAADRFDDERAEPEDEAEFFDLTFANLSSLGTCAVVIAGVVVCAREPIAAARVSSRIYRVVPVRAGPRLTAGVVVCPREPMMLARVSSRVYRVMPVRVGVELTRGVEFCVALIVLGAVPTA